MLFGGFWGIEEMLNYLLCTSMKRRKKMCIFLKNWLYYFCEWACICQSPTSQTLGLTCFFPICSYLHWVGTFFDVLSLTCPSTLENCPAVPTQAQPRVSHDLTISLGSIYPKETHTSVHQHTVLEWPQLSVTAWARNTSVHQRQHE